MKCFDVKNLFAEALFLITEEKVIALKNIEKKLRERSLPHPPSSSMQFYCLMLNFYLYILKFV